MPKENKVRKTHTFISPESRHQEKIRITVGVVAKLGQQPLTTFDILVRQLPTYEKGYYSLGEALGCIARFMRKNRQYQGCSYIDVLNN